VRRMVAVIEWGIIIMMYVRWKDILPLFRNYLQQQLASKASVPQFVTSPVEDAGVLQVANEPAGAQPVANDNDPSGLGCT
jgi:hypothetical protein